ncbi:hypothetical protein ASC89_00865 [Devosia sp. Root413D1]|uniref:hypothetical protein n=1 Tax=unclassified Devosia TaxID=196773 RepID=UPI0006F91C4E|nr:MULTISPECIES: hypothetical protein [unclassified Devosia]KQV09503.1 hypothetical protein ASC68_04210 [Devosia sp. Root105]KQW85665.1 hypothetical protein ASC89_00865 [Devosia sp. Root413D1]
MTVTQDISAPRRLPRQARIISALAARLQGPGGYYNVGNVLGLATALGLQFASAAGSSKTGTDLLFSYFVGSPQALAFTIATLIFLVGGEVYYRAWKDGAGPDQRLNRLGDLLSAAGGTALSVSLLLLGQPLLALATGAFVVLGKLGSAVFGDDSVAPPLWPESWPDPFRLAVLVGRAPAISAAGLDLTYQIGGGAPVITLIQPTVLIVCHVLWVKADLLLLGGGKRAAAAN